MLTFLFTFTSEFDTEQIVPTVSTLLELPVYPPPGVDLVSDENHRYGRPVHPVTYCTGECKIHCSYIPGLPKSDEEREVAILAPLEARPHPLGDFFERFGDPRGSVVYLHLLGCILCPYAGQPFRCCGSFSLPRGWCPDGD